MLPANVHPHKNCPGANVTADRSLPPRAAPRCHRAGGRHMAGQRWPRHGSGSSGIVEVLVFAASEAVARHHDTAAERLSSV
jgi:hypothetical protein